MFWLEATFLREHLELLHKQTVHAWAFMIMESTFQTSTRQSDQAGSIVRSFALVKIHCTCYNGITAMF